MSTQSGQPVSPLTAASLEVLAHEYTASQGRRGEFGVEHAVVATQLLADSRLDLPSTALWLHYLLIGSYVNRSTAKVTVATCEKLLAHYLSDAYPRDGHDAILVAQLEGSTADVVPPGVLRYIHSSKGTLHVGRLAVALMCGLLVVQHHRLQEPPGAMIVADLLRVVRHASVSSAEPLQCALVAAVLAALADLATPLILADASSLCAVLFVCSSVLEAAGESERQAWWVCEAATVAARLVCTLARASSDASALLSRPLDDLRSRGAVHLLGLMRSDSLGGRGDTSLAGAARMSAAEGAPAAHPASASGDATPLDLLLDHLLGTLPASADRWSLGGLRAAHACLQALAASCARGDPLRQKGFLDADLPRVMGTWLALSAHSTPALDPAAAAGVYDLARCAAISAVAQLAVCSPEGREGVLGAGAMAQLMSALSVPLLRPPLSLPHWPGALKAPVHAARALLLLVEGAACGVARPNDFHAAPVQVRSRHGP